MSTPGDTSMATLNEVLRAMDGLGGEDRAMNREEEVCRRIEEVGIVPIVRVPTATLALRAVDALLAGGVPVLEITLTVPDAIGLVRSLVERLGARRDVLVGAGTVLDAEAAAAAAPTPVRRSS